MTASDDLVVRLQEAIDEREKAAKALGGKPWHPDGFYVQEADKRDVARFGTKQEAVFVAAGGPKSVLRLCQAHRDIVAMYVEAKAQPVRREGREAPLRGLGHASAMGRLTTLGLVIQKLADGYGVTEQT